MAGAEGRGAGALRGAAAALSAALGGCLCWSGALASGCAGEQRAVPAAARGGAGPGSAGSAGVPAPGSAGSAGVPAPGSAGSAGVPAPGSAGSAGVHAPDSAASAGVPAPDHPPEDMLAVPAGEFPMGADDEGELDERPRHAVRVGAFWLDRTEVTNRAYLACVTAGRCRPWRDDASASLGYAAEKDFRGPEQPVVGVSWDDGVAYCGFRGRRLPTEAEWEYAARGSEGRHYPWGAAAPVRGVHGCFNGSFTDPVGSHPAGAGPFGHLDLSGNVWEWVADDYDPRAYTRPGAGEGRPGSCAEILEAQDELRRQKLQGFTGTNPIPTTCEKVLRGGAFNYHARGLRASNRVHHPGHWRLVMAGFRCAVDAPRPDGS